MMNEGREQTKTTIQQSMSITGGDVLKWFAEKGPEDGAKELNELVHELSAAVQEATSSVLQKHPECAAFFSVRGRVEIATSVQNKTADILGYLGFGPGCNMEYVEELEKWSKEKKEKSKKCRECSGEECECGSDDIPSPSPKIDKLMQGLKTLAELSKIMDDAADDTTDDSDKEEDEE